MSIKSFSKNKDCNSNSIINDLEFFCDNDLNEIFSENKKNYLLTNVVDNSQNLGSVKNINQESIISNNIDNFDKINHQTIEHNSIVKPVFSTSKALANLAQKNLMVKQNNENIAEIKKANNSQLISIDNIISKAKHLANQTQNILELKSIVENFDGCNLKKMSTNTVFADGNPNAKIMVIGEAPGNHEDLQGIPFCGDSGQMLDEMFSHINLSRKRNLYITNVIFWRPPGNRKPLEEELLICRPFLEKHIQLFQPKIIILVGATAMEAILGISEPITKIRGQILDFHPYYLDKPIKSFTIFHPSYLMRQSIKKKIAWQDMLTLENFIKNNLSDHGIFEQ